MLEITARQGDAGPASSHNNAADFIPSPNKETGGLSECIIERRYAGYRDFSLESDDHPIGAERELQPAALRLQFHGDALVVLEPQRAAALLPERPSRTNLAVNAGQVLSVMKAIDDPGSGELRGPDAAYPKAIDADRIGVSAVVQRSPADRARSDEGDLKLVDAYGRRGLAGWPLLRDGRRSSDKEQRERKRD